jgi:regulator of protease activity HflC (stomatin/prohibitin superfamily)
MFDSLIQLFLQFYEKLIPWYVVDEADEAVILRFGKFSKVRGPGTYRKIPFFDNVIVKTTVWTTISLPAQSLTTKDGVNIVIKAAIKYKVRDIKTFVLEVWDAVDALSDMTSGIIFDVVKEYSWEELKVEDLRSLITRKTRHEAKRWGLEVESVTLSDLAQIKSLRLINENVALN